MQAIIARPTTQVRSCPRCSGKLVILDAREPEYTCLACARTYNVAAIDAAHDANCAVSR